MNTDHKGENANNSHFVEESNKLVGKFDFNDFEEVRQFVVKVMKTADEVNHHPEVTFSYNWVRIEITTHDAGNVVTDKDHSLAEAITNI